MNQPPLDPIIPNIATRIKEMSYLKQTYLKFIIDLFPLLSNSLLKDFTNQLILLLQNLINIHKNEILFDIEDALTSVLISYIFDMDEIIKGHLDLEKYEPKHKNLVAINQQTNYYMKHHDPRGVEELREKMFLV